MLTGKENGIPGMFELIREDIATVIEKDPATRSSLEALLACPGVHALSIHRVGHWLWNAEFQTLGRFVSLSLIHI